MKHEVVILGGPTIDQKLRVLQFGVQASKFGFYNCPAHVENNCPAHVGNIDPAHVGIIVLHIGNIGPAIIKWSVTLVIYLNVV